MIITKDDIIQAQTNQGLIAHQSYQFNEFEPILSLTMTPMVNSMLRSVINTRFITALTGGKPITTIKKAKEAGATVKRVGTLFIGGGNLTFCQYMAEFAHLIRNSTNVVWLQDDYNLRMPILDGKGESLIPIALREIYNDHGGIHLWSTIPRNIKAFRMSSTPENNFSYVNLNALAFTGAPEELPPLTESGVFYYGAHREGREEGFKKYLKAGVKVYCVSKNDGDKFRAINISAQQARIDLNSLSTRGKLTIYLQDKFGDKHNCSPSARFYEYLSTGIPFVVARESLLTLQECDLDLSPWAVNSNEEVLLNEHEAEKIQDQQHRFAKMIDPIGDLETQFTAAFQKLISFERGNQKPIQKLSLIEW